VTKVGVCTTPTTDEECAMRRLSPALLLSASVVCCTGISGCTSSEDLGQEAPAPLVAVHVVPTSGSVRDGSAGGSQGSQCARKPDRTPCETDDGQSGVCDPSGSCVANQARACTDLKCNDALNYGQWGAFCPGSPELIAAVQACSEHSCQDACGDDPFRNLWDPQTMAACLDCLETACDAEVLACAADR
jgi:hypothetical protein